MAWGRLHNQTYRASGIESSSGNAKTLNPKAAKGGLKTCRIGGSFRPKEMARPGPEEGTISAQARYG